METRDTAQLIFFLFMFIIWQPLGSTQMLQSCHRCKDTHLKLHNATIPSIHASITSAVDLNRLSLQTCIVTPIAAQHLGFIEQDLVTFVGQGVLANGRLLGLTQTTVPLIFTDAGVHVTFRSAGVHHTGQECHSVHSSTPIAHVVA